MHPVDFVSRLYVSISIDHRHEANDLGLVGTKLRFSIATVVCGVSVHREVRSYSITGVVKCWLKATALRMA